MILEAIYGFFFCSAVTTSSRRFGDRGNYFVDKIYSDNPKEFESRARSARRVSFEKIQSSTPSP